MSNRETFPKDENEAAVLQNLKIFVSEYHRISDKAPKDIRRKLRKIYGNAWDVFFTGIDVDRIDKFIAAIQEYEKQICTVYDLKYYWQSACSEYISHRREN
jgi:hypothetical protein